MRIARASLLLVVMAAPTVDAYQCRVYPAAFNTCRTVRLSGFALTNLLAERRLSLVFTEDIDRYGTQLASGRMRCRVPARSLSRDRCVGEVGTVTDMSRSSVSCSNLDVHVSFSDGGATCIFSAQVPFFIRPANQYLTMSGPYVCTDPGGVPVERGSFTLKRHR